MTYRLQGVFTAIADPHRRQMLDYLSAEELTAGALAERFPISRPAVVRHLKVLEQCELIAITRRGRERVHRLNPTPLLAVRDWLQPYEQFWGGRLEALKAMVEQAAEAAGYDPDAPGSNDEGGT